MLISLFVSAFLDRLFELLEPFDTVLQTSKSGVCAFVDREIVHPSSFQNLVNRGARYMIFACEV